MTILCLPEISDNAMNAAWGTMPGAGLRCSEPHRDTQDRTEHQGTGSIHRQHCRCCPHSGSRLFRRESGNKVADKFARSGLTASNAEAVDAPVINEFPICLECRFIEYQNNEYGCGVIGKVVNVTADESVMVDGKIDMSKVNAIAFDPYTHGYYKVAERVGEAFHDGLKLKK